MKYLSLLLISIILISGCIEFPETKQSTFGFSENIANSDVYLSISSLQNETKTGRNVTLRFNVTNKRGSDIEDIEVNAYDQCAFSGEYLYNIDVIEPNRTKIWNWKWLTEDVQFERECEIKFKTDYYSEFILSQDIVVLSETEYYSREQAGTLSDLEPLSSSTSSPLSIQLTFSDYQPFLDGDSISMNIKYSNIGGGFVDVQSIEMRIPDNLEGNCNHYVKSGNIYTLDKGLTFYNNEAPQSTCIFTLKASQPIDVNSIQLTAYYKYSFDNSMIIKVKPK